MKLETNCTAPDFGTATRYSPNPTEVWLPEIAGPGTAVPAALPPLDRGAHLAIKGISTPMLRTHVYPSGWIMLQ